MDRAYVDLCMFVQFMHWTPNLPLKDMQILSEGTNEEVADYINNLKTEILDPSRVVHETYHIWQGLRLPYLHWYAFNCWTISMKLYVDLMSSVGLARLSPNEVDVPVFSILSKKYKCIFSNGLIFHIAEQDNKLTKSANYVSEISIIDLLETAATVAEWQFHAKGIADLNWKSFRRWTKKNPAYTEAYDFVCEGLENESLANRCILDLIAVSFETTKPVQTFLHLIALLKGGLVKSEAIRNFVLQEEPCRWQELFQMILKDNIEFEEFEAGNIETSKYSKIPLSQVVGMTVNGMPHPLLGHLAMKWNRRENENPAYTSVFTKPGWFGELTSTCLTDFRPPLTLIRIQLPNRLRVVTRANIEAIEKIGMHEIYNLITAFGIIRQASRSFIDPSNRLCHHFDCPEYDRNMCNLHMHIPLRHEDCKFPSLSKSMEFDIRSGK